jgi:hypothetical protein
MVSVKILDIGYATASDNKEYCIYICKFIAYINENWHCKIIMYTDTNKRVIMPLNNLELSNLQDKINEMM